MIRITHPRPQAGRQTALGVEFFDGFAEVTDLHVERERALTQHGFTITPVEKHPRRRRKGGAR
ncbi:hypothetical protein [Streptomyces sp. AC495_CC817]|uniref:hypothetical protein n=1 Tax=Streptomyces sp. AC495_CC817 TaxID=2823900 RepID=UPI001C264708|nr:hypothetical protein [Streptomyces sp. AC495_CC817]